MKKKKVNTTSNLLFSLTAVCVAYFINPNGRMSDIKGFFNIRFADGHHAWPYSSYIPFGSHQRIEAVEYPVITGIFQWIMSYTVPIPTATEITSPLKSPNALVEFVVPPTALLNGTWPSFFYYRLSVLILALVFAASFYYLSNLQTKSSRFLYLFSPAVLSSLFLNWDILCVCLLLISLHFYQQNKLPLSAITLSLAISTKFFPVYVLIPITVLLLKEKRFRELRTYTILVSCSWVLVNMPIALFDFHGWLRFYRYSFERDIAGDGSIFQIAKYFGFNQTSLVFLYYILNFCMLLLLMRFIYRRSSDSKLVELVFFAIVAFTFFGKVYSVQYVLWLTPLAVLSLRTRNGRTEPGTLVAFFFWQSCELFYHWAFYQYLIGIISKGTQGVSTNYFIAASATRFASLLIFTTLLAFSLKKNVHASRLGKQKI